MINSKMLKRRMKRLGISQKELARALGIAQPTFSQKINNVRPMGLQEAELIASMLGITDSDFESFFFWGNDSHRTVRVKVSHRKKLPKRHR